MVPEESLHSVDSTGGEEQPPKGQGSFVIDQEIHELIKTGNLVELNDILPTAFILSASQSNDMARFKRRFGEIHVGKGMCTQENVPEKHCK